jgi:hypothetical protein
MILNGLRRESATARLLGLGVRITLGQQMFASCDVLCVVR